MPGSRGRVPSAGSAGAGGSGGVRPSIRPSGWLGAAGLVALCLVVYLPGFFSLPPVDRDESRFAQASRQMFESVALPPAMRDPALHSGGLVIPKVQGRDRLNKPPLIYWLQAASAAVFTVGRPLLDSIWMYRVPSLGAVIAAVLLTWRLGSSMFDSRTGRLAAALLACCPIVAWEARQARADLVLLALNTAVMLALWRVYSSRLSAPEGQRNVATGDKPRSGAEPVESPPRGSPAPEETEEARNSQSLRLNLGWPLVFWLSLSLAILTKGPITPLIAALTAFFLCLISRRWRWLLALRPLLGLLIVAAVVAPWVYLVGERVGWSAYLKTVADETLGRVASSREGHWGPPGYHTLLLAVLFWPGSLMTAAGIALAFRQGLARATGGTGGPLLAGAGGWFVRLRSLQAGHAPYLFCLCWIIPAWIVFELIWTKLPHYTLPMYPAVAILSARAVLAADAGLVGAFVGRAGRVGLRIWVIAGIVLALGVPAAITVIGGRDGFWSAAAMVTAFAAAAAAAWQVRAAIVAVRSGRALRAQFRGVLAFVLVFVGSIGLFLPRAPGFWISPAVVSEIRAVDPQGSRPIGAIGYHEDSLVFLLRGRIARLSRDDTGAWTRENPRHLLVIPHDSVLRSHVVVGRAGGFNYSRGRWERLAVVHHFLDGREPQP